MTQAYIKYALHAVAMPGVIVVDAVCRGVPKSPPGMGVWFFKCLKYYFDGYQELLGLYG